MHHGNGADRERGEVGRAIVVAVVVRPVDRVVLEPLDVVLQVADDAALESHRRALAHRLVAGASPDDRRMRQTRCNVTSGNQ